MFVDQELEKIEKEEEMRAQMAVTPLRKITHKGEIEVQEETYQDLDTKLTEQTKEYDMDKREVAVTAGDHRAQTTAAAPSVRL